MRCHVLAACMVLVIATLSAAQADDCTPVFEAYDKLGKTPAYHQTVEINGKPLMDAIMVGDDFYVAEGSSWKKQTLPPGMREKMQRQVVPSAEALKDCALVGPDTIDGQSATIYDYTPPPMEGAGELGPQRVWISDATGLPLRMTSEQAKTDARLSFDNVTAPIP